MTGEPRILRCCPEAHRGPVAGTGAAGPAGPAGPAGGAVGASSGGARAGAAAKRPDTGGGISTGGSAPTDMQAAAVRRVAVFAFLHVIAALWGLFRENVLACLQGEAGAAATVRTGVVAVNLAASVAVGLLAWKGRLAPSRVLRIALVYEVLVSAGLSALDNFTEAPPGSAVIGMPRVCAVLLVAPLLILVRWRARVLTTALATLSFPATWALACTLGHRVPHGGEALLTIGPVVLCGGLALIAARSVGHLTAEVQRARAEARDVGSYRLVSVLGRGGMGEVWRAEHRMLARPAAIKVIRPENLISVTPERRRVVLERFRREAQDTALLTSPHTVQVFDFGLTEDGNFYYVMELLDGVDLNTVLKEEGAMPCERVVHLLAQACDSLAEAHGRGLVHRDLKPANLMTCRLGGHLDVVKVLDFGIVLRSEGVGGAPQDTPSDEAERLTVDGNLVGTPTYMPPEMALGQRAIDARADVYSLGCIAYALLTGRLPYDGANAVEMLVRHIQHPVPRVSAHAAVPQDLDDLVAACMAKKAGDRPPNAGALRDRLRSVRLERPWTEERAAAWWEERARRAAAAVPAAPAPAAAAVAAAVHGAA